MDDREFYRAAERIYYAVEKEVSDECLPPDEEKRLVNEVIALLETSYELDENDIS